MKQLCVLLLACVCVPLTAFGFAPVCQIQGQAKDPAGKAIATFGIKDGQEHLIGEARVEGGRYRIYFEETQRGTFDKILVRLQGPKKETLKEVTLPPAEKKAGCANKVDF